MYQLFLSSRAQKELKNLDRQTRTRIISSLKSLQSDPFSPGKRVERLTDVAQGWRLRVGDLRILYTLDTEIKLIRIYRIAKRGDIY